MVVEFIHYEEGWNDYIDNVPLPPRVKMTRDYLAGRHACEDATIIHGKQDHK